GTDVATAAAAVLYDDRLAPLRLQLVADDSGKHVVGAAAGIRNEKFYRSRWVPALPQRRVGPWRGNDGQDEDEGAGGKPSDHGDPRRNPGLPGFRSIARKSGRPDLRARSKDVQGCPRIQATRMPRPPQTRRSRSPVGSRLLTP